MLRFKLWYEKVMINMDAYTSFASVYDMFMDNIPYGEWCAYLTSVSYTHLDVYKRQMQNQMQSWRISLRKPKQAVLKCREEIRCPTRIWRSVP